MKFCFYHKWRKCKKLVDAKTDDCIFSEIKKAEVRQCIKCNYIQARYFDTLKKDYTFWRKPNQIIYWGKQLTIYNPKNFQKNINIFNKDSRWIINFCNCSLKQQLIK